MYRELHFSRIKIVATVGVGIVFALMPYISHASFMDELKQARQSSKESRETQREQFRLDLLQRREEAIKEWQETKGHVKESVGRGGKWLKERLNLRKKILREETAALQEQAQQKSLENEKEEEQLSALLTGSFKTLFGEFSARIESLLHAAY